MCQAAAVGSEATNITLLKELGNPVETAGL